MLIEQLRLENFGTYQGQHVFDLAPRVKYGYKRPIILFGGLNGSGKTTFLNAVRLALYGRQGLSAPLTQKEYESVLTGLIHVSPAQLVKANRATVELLFSHARLGQTTRYRVLRHWHVKGSTFEEGLQIFVDVSQTPYLFDEQAQAFLSQLIPFGVSQFFFFDGEQIADLANDDGDQVLGDAVRRLLGLDIASRLNSDLSVFLRNHRTDAASQDARTKLKEHQATYDRLMQEIEDAQAEIQQVLQPQIDAAVAAKETMQSHLSERGGAWAINRSEVEARLDAIREEKAAVEALMREILAGPAVFSFATELCQKLESIVRAEQTILETRAAAAALNANVQQLKSKLSDIAGSNTWRPVVMRCIDGWLTDMSPKDAPRQTLVHGLTGTDAQQLLDTLSTAAASASTELSAAQRRLRQLGDEELLHQDKLAHAPSDASIQDAFVAFEQSTGHVAILEAKRKAMLEDIRRKLWIAIDVTRKKKRLENDNREVGVSTKAQGLAENLREVIADFQVRATQLKCEQLRVHFMTAFGRLARKDDMIRDARIDPSSFTVTLFGPNGQAIPKARLSAGERQIFAIAMLEALGKTSGRSLPVIIDTPLGRLDSAHRERLVESYFPKASHQVIVLSTDTEVDQRFYEGLRSKVSHAFHLKFDPASRSTSIDEGYFWKGNDLYAA